MTLFVGKTKMIKQVIIMRTDLNMRKGKMVAQGSHASMKVFFDKMQFHPVLGGFTSQMIEWAEGSFAKIVVGVNSLEELLELERKAKESKIPCALITDLGKTEFKEPTITCLAIGPDESEKIDPITGSLKLL